MKKIYVTMVGLLAFITVITILSLDVEGADHTVGIGGDFATIQGAIDDAGTADGDTIYIWEGNYSEELNITKSLSLIGNGTGSLLFLEKLVGDEFLGFSIEANNTLISNMSVLYEYAVGGETKLLDCDGFNNITLDNLNITNTNPIAGNSYRILDVDNCDIFAFTNTNISQLYTQVFSGFRIEDSTNISIENNEFYYSVFSVELDRTEFVNIENNTANHGTEFSDFIMVEDITDFSINNNTLAQNYAIPFPTFKIISVIDGTDGIINDNINTNVELGTIYLSGNNITANNNSLPIFGWYYISDLFNSTVNSPYRTRVILAGFLNDSVINIPVPTVTPIFTPGIYRSIIQTNVSTTFTGDFTAENSSLLGTNVTYNINAITASFSNCTFNTSVIDNSTTTTYENVLFQNDNLNTSKYLIINGQATINSSNINETLVIITEDTIITNTTFNDQLLQRSAYTNLFVNGSNLRSSNSTFFGGTNSLQTLDGNAYIDNTTFDRSLLSNIIATNGDIYLNYSTLDNTETGIQVHTENGTLRSLNTEYDGGRISLNRATAFFNRSTLSTLDIQATSADIHIYNSTLRSLDYYLEDSNITGYNTRLSRDDVNFYFYSTITQKWLVFITTDPNTAVEVQGNSYTSDANGELAVWVQQWTWDNDQFNDTTSIPVTIGTLDTRYYYVSNATWINLTEDQTQIQYDIRAGWNLLGMSVETNETALSTLQQLGYGSSMYTRDNGTYTLVTYGANGLKGTNFKLETGIAYYIYSKNSAPIKFNVTELTKNSTRYAGGWNLMTIPQNIEISYQEFFTQNPSVSMIYQRDPFGEYTLYQRGSLDASEMVASDGYYIYVEGDGVDWFWKSGGSSQ